MSNEAAWYWQNDPNSKELKIVELDAKKIAFTSQTEFFVQVGKGPKGSYKTKYKIKGNFTQAWMHYCGVNIGYGYKKRLLMPNTIDNPILTRQFS